MGSRFTVRSRQSLDGRVGEVVCVITVIVYKEGFKLEREEDRERQELEQAQPRCYKKYTY